MAENAIQKAVMLSLGSDPSIRVFRNNVGVGSVGNPPTKIRFGLFPGSGDLIGWRSYLIDKEDVGKTIAVFSSVEVKDENGTVAQNQKHWANVVNESGGIAIIARDAVEAKRTILSWRPTVCH